MGMRRVGHASFRHSLRSQGASVARSERMRWGGHRRGHDHPMGVVAMDAKAGPSAAGMGRRATSRRPGPRVYAIGVSCSILIAQPVTSATISAITAR